MITCLCDLYFGNVVQSNRKITLINISFDNRAFGRHLKRLVVTVHDLAATLALPLPPLSVYLSYCTVP